MELAAKKLQIASLEAKAHELSDSNQAAAARVARVRAQFSCGAFAFSAARIYLTDSPSLCAGEGRFAAQQQRAGLAGASGGGNEAGTDCRICCMR
jgi:hypothetical protein